MTEPKITQAMIDAYDAYTHVTLDRRGLVARLATLAGGTAAAYAVLPMLEARPAHAAIIAEDDKRVVSETVSWPGANGQTMRGTLARPATAAGKRPTVMVIHENRGLNGYVRDVARRLAVDGFVALAPDFLSPGGGTPADEDKAREAIGALQMPQTIGNAVATVAFLKRHPLGNGKVGAVGFCWGGAMVNQTAIHAGRLLDAGVAFYGMTPNPADVPRIEAAMQLHFAGLDQRINAGIPAYEGALKAAGVKFESFMYPTANHAFHNDTSEARYDKAAADLAWKRTVDLFRRALA